MAQVSLVFPPHWYYACVPADLLYTGSQLRARGLTVRCFDLHAELLRDLLRRESTFAALREPATYTTAERYQQVSAAVDAECLAVSERFQVDFSFYSLAFAGVDEGAIPQALAVGLDPRRNPALPTLEAAVPRLLADSAESPGSAPIPAAQRLIAVALVHPGQLVQALTLGRLLRQAGFAGFLAIYGAHEDVLAPEDFAPDLLPQPGAPLHRLFDDFDGVIIGEAETALQALAEALAGQRAAASVPSLLCPRWGLGQPVRGQESVRELAAADFSLVDGSLYPFPTPVVDLRLSRGCPWGRCTFCAIAQHQEGYRSRPTAAAVRELQAAQQQLGARFFRFRDDLLTPRQLRELASELGALPAERRPRFSARARFEPGFTRELLQQAAAAGLEELWLGLESAVPRVRDLMKKGVGQPLIERILVDAAAAGIRVRALCMLGYPGETAAEIRQTFAFLARVQPLLASVSMTPFFLMRRAPMGQDPAAFGLTELTGADADPVPRHERLRFALRARWPGALAPAELAVLIDECAALLGPELVAKSGGPSLAHAWLHASALRHGWPA
jgi:hypothetical protein